MEHFAAVDLPFYETFTFNLACLIFQAVTCLIIIPLVIYVVAFKIRFHLDPSAYLILGSYSFSFIARLVIYTLEIQQEENQSATLEKVLQLLISIKAGIVAATLYYFVMEMGPIRTII